MWQWLYSFQYDKSRKISNGKVRSNFKKLLFKNTSFDKSKPDFETNFKFVNLYLNIFLWICTKELQFPRVPIDIQCQPLSSPPSTPGSPHIPQDRWEVEIYNKKKLVIVTKSYIPSRDNVPKWDLLYLSFTQRPWGMQGEPGVEWRG